MSIVSCPRCGDKVSVPPAASPAALVQCPLCCEEYFLSDALIQLPPMLVVVGGHAGAGDKDADYRLAEPVSAAVREASLDSIGSTADTVAARPQLRTVARPRRPEKSAVGEIVKVVLGGAAGLAGGLLVLWWGFGVDVGELGPKLSKVEYLRFLVPQKLWDQSVRNGEGSVEPEPATADTSGQKGSAADGSGQLASDKASGNSGAADGSTSDKSGKNKEPDDPFLTLDNLGGETKPAGSSPVESVTELTLDDPLSATRTPKKDDAPKAKEDSPASDEPKATTDAADEKKPAEPTEPAKEKTDGDKPAAENPEEKRADDEKKDPPAEEAAPE